MNFLKTTDRSFASATKHPSSRLSPTLARARDCCQQGTFPWAIMRLLSPFFIYLILYHFTSFLIKYCRLLPRVIMPTRARDNCRQGTFPWVIMRLLSSFFINLILYHFTSLKYNTQRLNRRNRGLVLVTNWSKELILIKYCRD